MYDDGFVGFVGEEDVTEGVSGVKLEKQ